MSGGNSGAVYEISAGEGRFRLSLAATWAGNDLVVTITGGDAPHIGSVAVAVPRPSLRDPSVTSATASVITLVGHKDDELAKPIAEFMAARLKVAVVAVVGIHVDGATPDDVECLRDIAWELARSCVAGAVRQGSGHVRGGALRGDSE
ncbi:MAG: hypothetical protein NUW12_04575 [Firmicutes bacterium]|jgi:hypothetical protein|nr:hypothetical protein [Bacillota bacterium]MDH7495223.1 hypothetical protein [Bacillota bacterium]